jgi:tetratricopeptide (TPR) repeat protein
MLKKAFQSTFLVGLVILFYPLPTSAFHGGGHGGGGGGGGGGGFRGGGGGGFRGGGVPAHVAPPAFNRTPSFSAPRAMPQQVRPATGNINRGASFNNANRSTTINNINRSTTVNNVNRMGNGWQNNYMGYHSGWVHGYWNGHNPGGFGWRPYGGYGGYGYGLGGYGYGLGGYGFGSGLGYGLGLGMGWGLSSWMMGPMLYNYGYSNYSNPYYGGGYGGGNAALVQNAGAYDYGQPIDSQATPPDQTVSTQAVSTFDSAREAFKAGDYAKALDLVDQAIKLMPNDATLHEFRAQTLFALNRYDDAAATLYGVLSAGPGWDWTTLISLYSDPEVYTKQLRALETFCSQNSSSASAHFVLAYQYLTEEHPEAAARQLKTVTALQPKDTLSAQLLQQLEQSQTQPSGATTAAAQPAQDTSASSAASAAPGNDAKLVGSWTAQPNKDIAITLALQDEGRFVWSVNRAGKEQRFAGKSTFENGILTLVQDDNNNTMVANVNRTDDGHFTFKVMGAAPGDPGLSFAKA